jgi:hypothetical protein
LVGLEIAGRELLAIVKEAAVAMDSEVIGGEEAIPVSIDLVAKTIFEGVIVAINMIVIAIMQEVIISCYSVAVAKYHVTTVAQSSQADQAKC